MKTHRIAFFPILRQTFDVAFAQQMIDASRTSLQNANLELVEPEDLISNLESAKDAASLINHQPVDALVIFQATFADSTLASALVANTSIPVYLWAVPEPWTGERLRLNSFCGINLAAHSLKQQGKKFKFGYGLPNAVDILKDIRHLAAVGELIRKLQNATLGVVGEHPEGFDSCYLDKNQLESIFGIQVKQIPLQTVFENTRNISDQAVNVVRKELDLHLDNLASLDQDALKGTLKVYLALNEIANELEIDGLAVRCWPEFFTELGCAACGAMSMLSDGFLSHPPIPCSCEADINGTLTQLILQWLSDAPAFGTDIVGVNKDKDQVALWHCGLAPLSMADPSIQPHGTIHSNRQLPLLMDFALKPGKVTIARVNHHEGGMRLVIGEGEMLSENKPFSGTSGIFKPLCSAQNFMDTLMNEGLEHHISLTYGEYAQDLKIFAEWLGLPLVNLGKED